ncbi:hypothetical protein [Gracilimonas sp.]|uniref:hypothetical protein n=1 Tax=Gracilimonas sp. TaxID=1974203 RepID=UPI0032F017B6
MYRDLADAVESLKEKGFDHTYELGDDCITCKEMEVEYSTEDLSIIETHKFDQGTDPGSESTVYAIESDNGVKGTLIISYGKYVDPQKAELIDRLLESHEA